MNYGSYRDMPAGPYQAQGASTMAPAAQGHSLIHGFVFAMAFNRAH